MNPTVTPPTVMKSRPQIEHELQQAEIKFYSLNKNRNGKKRQMLWNHIQVLKWVLGKEKKE